MVAPARLPRLSRRGSVPDVRQAREDLLERGALPVGVRGMVADSWLRSAAAGVNADSSQPPITLATDLLADYRAEHPLAEIFPLLYDVLGRAAEDCDSVMAVADERGQLLWVCGKPACCGGPSRSASSRARSGTRRHAGTNAPGTALRLDAPVTIQSAEHFVRPVQRWSCAAAPIHDPGSRRDPRRRRRHRRRRRRLAADDRHGPGRRADGRVRAGRRAASGRGAVPGPGRARRAGTASARHGDRACSGLGRPDCVVIAAPATLRLSPRHSEILVGPGRPPGRADRRRAGRPALSRRRRARARCGPSWSGCARCSAPGAGLPAVPAHLRGHVGLGRGQRRSWRRGPGRGARGCTGARCCRAARRPAWSELRGDLHRWLRAVILADGPARPPGRAGPGPLGRRRPRDVAAPVRRAARVLAAAAASPRRPPRGSTPSSR